MRMTNDTYCIVVRGKKIRERYYRDQAGWLKASAPERVSRMTAEQVLNHLLPALASGQAKGLTVTVEHHDTPYWERVLYGLADAD